MDTTQRRAKARKTAVLTMRITQLTKDALTSVAEAEGRAVSEVAERWLDAAREGHLAADQLLGAPGLEQVFRQFVAFSQFVRERIGDPATDNHARNALVVGLQYLPAFVVPLAKPSERETKLASARLVVSERAADFLAQLKDLYGRNPTHPVIADMTSVPNAYNALAYTTYTGQAPGAPARSLAEDLQTLANGSVNRSLTSSIFSRLDAIPDDRLRGEEQLMAALVELMRAHNAYLEQWCEHEERRVDTMGAVNAYLEQFSGGPIAAPQA